MSKRGATLEPTWEQENPLPESVIWEDIIDKPEKLSELDPDAAQDLEDVFGEFENLGDLAYEDLVDSLHIAAQAVTNAKIAVDAIQGDVIAAAAITTTKIADNSIESGKIQANAIIASKIAANAITASKIDAGAVTASKIDAGAVTAGKIAAGAIDGITITGSLIRTSSSGTRVELNASNNDIRIYSGSTLRAKGYNQGWEWYNPSGTLVGEIYASSSNELLLAADLLSSGKIFYGVGVSGTHSFHIGTSGSTMRLYIDDDTMMIGDADDFDYDIQFFGLPVFNHDRAFITPTVGRVSSAGSLSGGGIVWSATRNSTGVYTVTHNLGSSSYSVVACVESSTGDLKCKIGSRGSSSFEVRVDSAGTLTNAAFNFVLFFY